MNRAVLSLTSRASRQIISLVERKNNPNICGVKIGLKKRGCDGLSYTMNYVSNDSSILPVDPGDEKIKIKEDLALFIDKSAIMFIIGTEMDYEETDISSEFVFNNPNAKSNCGCGSSFSLVYMKVTFKEIFEYCDSDKDGYLSKNVFESGKFIRLAGYCVSDDIVASALARVASTKETKITLSELQRVIESLACPRGVQSESLQDALNRLSGGKKQDHMTLPKIKETIVNHSNFVDEDIQRCIDILETAVQFDSTTTSADVAQGLREWVVKRI